MMPAGNWIIGQARWLRAAQPARRRNHSRALTTGLAPCAAGFRLPLPRIGNLPKRCSSSSVVALLLPRHLPLADDLPAGGTGDRGEIVKITPQGLAPGPDRGAIPPFGKAFGAAGC